ncbi:MAG: EAL domain-containing protein [Chloroflexi bacterium]|nr:EAL domain-containing protein [Chloroflexota bacterium]
MASVASVAGDPRKRFAAVDPDVLRRIYEVLPYGIVVRDARGQIVYANPATVEILGAMPGTRDIMAEGWAPLNEHGERDPGAYPGLLVAHTGKPLRNQMLRLVNPEGQTKWLQIDAIPLMDAAGNVEQLVISMVDVTDHNEAELALRESNRRYEDLIDSTWDVVLSHSLDGHVIEINSAGAAALGYAPEALAGADIRRLLPPDEHGEIDRYLADIAANGSASGLLSVLTAAGPRRVWEYRNSLREEAGSRVVRVVARDVTERRRAEQALRSRARQQAAAAEIGQLAVSGSLAELLEAIPRRFCETLQVELAAIIELLPEQQLRVMSSYGEGALPAGEALTHRPDSATSEALLRKRAIIVPDYQDQALFILSNRLRAMRSSAVVPVFNEQGCQAVISAYSRKPRAFTDADVDFMQALASIVGSAISRESARQALAESELRYRSIVETANEGVGTIDLQGRLTYVNSQLAGMLGYTPDEMLGRPMYEFMMPEERAAASTGNDDFAEQSMRLDRHLLRKDGSGIWVSVSISRLYRGGQCIGSLAVMADMTERRKVEEDLARQALHDALTGLPNRVLLYDRLQQAVLATTRRGASGAILLMDLDGFKEINDSLGHPAGDAVLKDVSARLQNALRDSDTVARLGGDEFAVLLPNCRSASDVAVAAAKVRQALLPPVRVEGCERRIQASLGAALYPKHGSEVEILMRRADTAMYSAKRNHSHFALFTPDQDEEISSRLSLTSDLRSALEAEQIEIAYQPVLDLASGTVHRVEALARWQHPRRGAIEPRVFVGLAEDAGLIQPLLELVLRRACRDLATWQTAGFQLDLAINISPRNLTEPELPKVLRDILAEHDIDPSRVTLEINEASFLSDGRNEPALAAVRALGCRLAVDDFGSGFSSLAQLRHLAVDEIKIDGAFLAGLADNPRDEAIVRSVTQMGRNLGLRVVAEGVEQEASLARLVGIGCDEAQGFCIARPMAAWHVPEVISRLLPR